MNANDNWGPPSIKPLPVMFGRSNAGWPNALRHIQNPNPQFVCPNNSIDPSTCPPNGIVIVNSSAFLYGSPANLKGSLPSDCFSAGIAYTPQTICVPAILNFLNNNNLTLGLSVDGPGWTGSSTSPQCSTTVSSLTISNLTKIANYAAYLHNATVYAAVNEPLTHVFYQAQNSSPTDPNSATYTCTLPQIAMYLANLKNTIIATFTKARADGQIEQVIIGDEEVPVVLAQRAINSSGGGYPPALGQYAYSDLDTFFADFLADDYSENSGSSTAQVAYGFEFFQLDQGYGLNWLPTTKSLLYYLQNKAPGTHGFQKIRVGLLLVGDGLKNNMPANEAASDPQASVPDSQSRDKWLATAQAGEQMYYLSSAISPASALGSANYLSAPDDIIFAEYGSGVLNQPTFLPDNTYVTPGTVVDDHTLSASEAYLINWFFNDANVGSYSDSVPPTPLYRVIDLSTQRTQFTYSGIQASRLAASGWQQRYPLGNIYQEPSGAPGLTALYSYVDGHGANYLKTASDTSPLPSQFSSGKQTLIGYVYPTNSCTAGSYLSVSNVVCSGYTPQASVVPSSQSCANNANLPVYELVNTASYPAGSPEYFYTADPTELCKLVSSGAWTTTSTTNGAKFNVLPLTAYQTDINGMDITLVESLYLLSSATNPDPSYITYAANAVANPPTSIGTLAISKSLAQKELGDFRGL